MVWTKIYKKHLTNISAQIEEILRNVDPASENLFLKKTCICFLIPIWKVANKYLFSVNSLYQGIPYFLVHIWYKYQIYYFLLLLCQTVRDF